MIVFDVSIGTLKPNKTYMSSYNTFMFKDVEELEHYQSIIKAHMFNSQHKTSTYLAHVSYEDAYPRVAAGRFAKEGLPSVAITGRLN